MQDYAPTNLPSISFPNFGFPNLGLGISSEILSLIFYFTLAFALIYTILLFNLWRKHSPSPLKALKYAAFYIIGTAILLLVLMSLLPLYSVNA